MKNVPVRWSFKTDPFIRVLRITGECDETEVKECLITQLVAWIDVATRLFYAITIAEPPGDLPNANISVSSTLMFDELEDLEDFKDFIKSIN